MLASLWRCCELNANTTKVLDELISCWDISLKTANVNLMVAPKKESKDPQSHYDSSSGNRKCLYKDFAPIHGVDI